MSGSSVRMSRPVVGTVLEAAQPPARSSGRRRSMCRLSLAATDLLVAQAALMLVIVAAQTLTPITGLSWSLPLGVAATFGALSGAMAFGAYDLAAFGPLERFRVRVYAFLMLPPVGMAALALFRPLTPGAVGVLVGMAVLFLPLSLMAGSAVRHALIAKSIWREDVLIIGSGEAAARLVADLLAHPQTGLRPIGYCGEHGGLQFLPRLGPLDHVEALGSIADTAVVVLSAETQALDVARLPFDRIVLAPDIQSMPVDGVRTRALGSIPVLDFANPGRARMPRRVKRVLDYLIAAPALLITLPLIVGIALTIALLSPGPVFYRQERIGFRGRKISILKLRSMYIDAERRLEELLSRDVAARQQWETYVKLDHDPRVLPIIGQFIRKTSIDELPQLWNVLRGELSLVGPRPFPSYHIEKFPSAFQALRCSVQPGLTGLWQISDRSSANLRRQEALDTFYIRNWSLWLDMYVVFRTLPAILRARGAR